MLTILIVSVIIYVIYNCYLEFQYFEEIEYSYEYIAPVTDGKNKITNINYQYKL